VNLISFRTAFISSSMRHWADFALCMSRKSSSSAFLGGLLALLAGPVLLHAQGHLELITLGWFPLFLAAWVRWFDCPSPGRLLAAAGLFVLVALGTAYLALFATVPAGLYVLWRLLRPGTTAPDPALAWRRRGAHLLAFVALTLPCLGLLFYNQLWSRAHGYTASWPKSEFVRNSSPYYSYVVPSSSHLLGRLLPWDLYGRLGWSEVEGCSYLGVVTLLLIGCALCRRADFARRGYWWTLFGLLVLLSFGARGGAQQWQNAWLPALWLQQGLPLLRPVRVPARFNLCVVPCACLLAAVGLRQLLAAVRRPWLRGAVVAVLAAVAFLDLAVVPFPAMRCPDMPPCYALLLARKPDATFLEVPHYNTGWGTPLAAAATYWQGLHRGTTTAGYSGFDNQHYVARVYLPSPFAWYRLRQQDYLTAPDGELAVDLVRGTRSPITPGCT
jgi:hypothetical protein